MLPLPHPRHIAYRWREYFGPISIFITLLHSLYRPIAYAYGEPPLVSIFSIYLCISLFLLDYLLHVRTYLDLFVCLKEGIRHITWGRRWTTSCRRSSENDNSHHNRNHNRIFRRHLASQPCKSTSGDHISRRRMCKRRRFHPITQIHIHKKWWSRWDCFLANPLCYMSILSVIIIYLFIYFLSSRRCFRSGSRAYRVSRHPDLLSSFF